MTSITSIALSFLLLSPSFQQSPAKPENEAKDKQANAQKPETSLLKQPLDFGLEDGTPVKLRLTRDVSSADATAGERVSFEVLEDIRVKDIIVIPRDAIAGATVTEAQHKRRIGRAGKLTVSIDDVRLSDGEKAPLRAVKRGEGGGQQGAMTGAIVRTASVFPAAAPLVLLMQGKDVTIPNGTEITAYINGDIPLDPKRFASKLAEPSASATSSVEIKSTPGGAEITVDDKFVGNTPSTLRLTEGDHKIKLEKAGFKAWEKIMTVAFGGTITLNSQLEKVQKQRPSKTPN
jgi:hypothetical protein